MFFGGRRRGREEDVPPSPLSPPTRIHIDVLSEQTLLVFILPPIFAHNATSRKRPILTVFIGWVLLGGPPPPHEGLGRPSYEKLMLYHFRDKRFYDITNLLRVIGEKSRRNGHFRGNLRYFDILSPPILGDRGSWSKSLKTFLDQNFTSFQNGYLKFCPKIKPFRVKVGKFAEKSEF